MFLHFTNHPKVEDYSVKSVKEVFEKKLTRKS